MVKSDMYWSSPVVYRNPPLEEQVQGVAQAGEVQHGLAEAYHAANEMALQAVGQPINRAYFGNEWRVFNEVNHGWVGNP